MKRLILIMFNDCATVEIRNTDDQIIQKFEVDDVLSVDMRRYTKAQAMDPEGTLPGHQMGMAS